MSISFSYVRSEMIDTKVYSLLKVNECGSFAAAAKQLSITQPAVSQHIKALEEELGVRIFERSSGKLVLTKQGGEVVKYALKMVGLYNSLRQSLQSTPFGYNTLQSKPSYQRPTLRSYVLHQHSTPPRATR